MRVMAMVWMARLRARSPRRLGDAERVLPLLTGSGLVPDRAANAASLRHRPGWENDTMAWAGLTAPMPRRSVNREPSPPRWSAAGPGWQPTRAAPPAGRGPSVEARRAGPLVRGWPGVVPAAASARRARYRSEGHEPCSARCPPHLAAARGVGW